MDAYKEAKEMMDQLVEWRRTLHQMPELDITLPRTVAYISAELDKMGIEHTVYNDISCITAVIGHGPKCLMLRGDIDGLPIIEKSGLDFASTNGCAHACGHDLHGTTMLGVAKLLKAHEDELKCTVKILIQSGEETFHGAKAAIKAGVMENPKVDAAYGMHVFAASPLGTFMWGQVSMGAVYGFRITLTGVGSHGSTPELSIDPINAGVHLYLGLQELIAREIAPMQPASLTIGSFNAGAAANAIPDTCVLQGTLRTFDKDTRAFVIRRITEVGQGVAATYRCKFDLEVINDVPSVVCDLDFSEKVFASLEKTGLVKNFVKNLRVMGSEDFACYADLVPSCYVSSGASPEDASLRRGQHNPEIIFNEEAIPVDVAAYVQVAMDFE